MKIYIGLLIFSLACNTFDLVTNISDDSIFHKILQRLRKNHRHAQYKIRDCCLTGVKSRKKNGENIVGAITIRLIRLSHYLRQLCWILHCSIERKKMALLYAGC